MKDSTACRGCRNDFYNGSCSWEKECWHLKTARIVTRYTIGFWTLPTQPGAFTKVRLPNCFNVAGTQAGYAIYDELPECAEEVMDGT